MIALLLDRGTERILVACRDGRRGKKLLRSLRPGGSASVIPWEHRGETDSELVVNCTPLGQKGKDPLPVTKGVIRRARAVVDLVVRPPGTRLVALARREGVSAHEGSAMLIAQGRESFRHWFGKRPPRRVMEEAIIGG